MSVGQFVFMLHSHLPYYRKAGMWPFGEENFTGLSEFAGGETDELDK